jgi:F-type H+-transporting ATPase subunit a
MWDVTLAATVLTVVLIFVTRRVVRALPLDQAPKGRLANAVEAVLQYIQNEVIIPAGGKHIAPYTPIFLTYFFFILTSNLLGMIPEVGTGTANIGVTMALGGSIYLLVLGLGMWNQGPVKYWVNLVPHGTPLALAPLMLFLEIISPIVKCFVLCVRLFANMMAGHVIISNVLVLGAFGKGAMLGAFPVLVGTMLLFGVPLAVGVSLLEILVCFLQAYVFTMLSVIFVAAAVHPEH